MTVCIAAICNVGPLPNACIVGAADRMITRKDREYQPDQTKLLNLASHTVALLQGEMALHAVVCPEVMREIPKHMPGMLVREIAELYATRFSHFSQAYAEREVLAPLGLSRETFLSKQRTMSRDFQLHITKQLQDFSIDANALIAGRDQHGVHIYRIGPPGAAHSCNTECFAAIGVGEDFVDTQFMASGYSKNWSIAQALMLAYSAKRDSEMNAGIGDQTDVCMVTPQGAFMLNQEEKKALNQIYLRKKKRDKRSTALANQEIQNYIDQATERARKKAEEAPQPDIAPGSQTASATTSSSDQTF